MILDIRDYHQYSEQIIELYKDKGIEEIRIFCCLTSIPLIAAFTYILDDNPNDEDVKQNYKNIYNFYGYTKIQR